MTVSQPSAAGAARSGGVAAALAWGGRPQWRILHLGFGDGGEFLRTWQAWRTDRQRPALLHYVALDAVVCAPGVLAEAAGGPEAAPCLLDPLLAAWFGFVPGMHRLAFEDGRVLLTLCLGEPRALLRELAFRADSVVLDGPEAPELHRLKAIARLSRRGTRLVWGAGAAPGMGELRQCGFVPAAPGLQEGATAGAGGGAVFDPPWPEKRPPARVAAMPGRCVVVGGGLAGAAAAASLARRGWDVQVLDAAQEPASGASSLPAGLLAPHQSPDDSLLSRLSRAGLRMTLGEAARLLESGVDWAMTGALSHRAGVEAALPARPAPELAAWSAVATPAQKAQAQLASDAPALWHERAAWIRPAALVRAWLGHPGVHWRGGVRVARIEPCPQGWRLCDSAGGELGQAALVVVAAACASNALLPQPLPLQPVRGQVSWSTAPAGASLPPFAVNGDGHFLPRVPTPDGEAWLCGATFDRDDTDLTSRLQDRLANLGRLRRLLPVVAAALAPRIESGQVHDWTGVRCASADRRPLVGEWAPGLWVSTAMGSRGLSYACLCAELIAARLHAEPLPLPQSLAAAVDVQRLRVAPR